MSKYTAVYTGNVVGIYKDGEQITIDQIVADLNAKAVEPVQAVPVGYCLMPREPTQWMREQIACGIESNSVADVWGRLIRAVDIENKHRAKEPAQAVPVAWKHDCAALLTNNVELWIDACPHCGKPRSAPPAIDDETCKMALLIREAVNKGIFQGAIRRDAISILSRLTIFHGGENDSSR